MNDLYRKMLRWAALPVTDRRWGATLSAVALGFGLFVGVALSPGASGGLASGAPQIVEMPPLLAGGGGEEVEGEGEGEEVVEGEAAPEYEEPTSSAPAPSPMATSAESAAPPPSGEGSAAKEEEAGGAPQEEAEEEPAPEPESPDLAGVVVHVNPAAGSYTVVEEGGLMTAVHTAKPPAAGARIEVPIRTLANGTLAEGGRRKAKGTVKKTTLAGIVTFVDATPSDPAYAVSNRGVSLLVHVRPDPAGAAPKLPELGAYASVAVEIEAPTPPVPAPESSPAPAAGCQPDPTQAAAPAIVPRGVLWQSTISSGGAPFTSSAFEGIVAGVCAETGQVLISADDTRESGRDLLFTVPAGIKTTKIKIGESVLVNAAIAADGSLSLTGLASDELVKGADDAALAQGDLVPAKGAK